jgi:phi LC3 family holin
MINWKLRLKNKATLVTLTASVLSLIYMILAMLGITPKVSQDEVYNLIIMAVNILVLLGIVVDPTTEGVSDSDRAMAYDEPSPQTKVYRR